MRRAPAAPSRQWLTTKSKGDRQTSQAGLLERRQLVEAGGEEQQAAQPRAGRRHVHRREQGQPLEAPLGERRGHAEAAPGQQVAGREQGRRRIRPGLGAAAPVDGGEDEDHRRRAGQHHAGHHDPPHQEQQDEIDGAFRFHRHGHGHVAHRPHVRRGDEQVEPAERGEAGERRRDHDALAQHQVEQRRGGWWRAGGGSPEAVRPPRQKARSARCCPCLKG